MSGRSCSRSGFDPPAPGSRRPPPPAPVRRAEAPPRVEYSLTAAGQDLLVPIRALGDWAAVYADQLPTENTPIRRSLRNGG
ncbi:winged helix-turn-helix transcriptional regulator [Kribbella sp. NPDC004875]|uniref:winged helix-turn-helix transcriptional regulator n=1 Tax=Kribbella sp. NPDC004875 TaxID=3364107 RepID=UPI00367776A9